MFFLTFIDKKNPNQLCNGEGKKFESEFGKKLKQKINSKEKFYFGVDFCLLFSWGKVRLRNIIFVSGIKFH